MVLFVLLQFKGGDIEEVRRQGLQVKQLVQLEFVKLESLVDVILNFLLVVILNSLILKQLIKLFIQK